MQIDNFIVQMKLKLMRTLLNYRVLGTITATLFSFKWSFSLCTYIPRMDVMLDFICMGPVDRKERIGSDEIQNEKFLPTVGLEPTTLRFQVWCSND